MIAVLIATLTIAFRRSVPYHFSIFFLLLCPSVILAQAIERELFLELDPIKDAVAYEIKIEPINGTLGQVVTKRMKKLEFAKKLPLGSYQIYTRSFDARNTPGKWSDLGKAEIQFKAPLLQKPEPNQKFTILDKQPIKIDFAWTSFHPKAKFKFILKDSSGKIVSSKIIEGGDYQIALPSGTYAWQVVSNPPPRVSIQGQDPSALAFEIIEEPKLPEPKPIIQKNVAAKEKAPVVKKPLKSIPAKTYRNLASASVGPVLWSYQFKSNSGGDSFQLSAATVTSLAGDLIHWFGDDLSRGWGIEVRGRQTNIYLFPDGDPNNETQTPVTVADRRIGLMPHIRKSWGNLALDGLLGFGTHHYTYLIQDGTIKNVRSNEGELREFYLGGSLDWTTESKHHASLDLTFHPVSASQAISVSQTSQYTLSFKFLQKVFNDRFYINYDLENIRSSVTLTSDYFTGEATTVATWYRLGLGIGAAF